MAVTIEQEKVEADHKWDKRWNACMMRLDGTTARLDAITKRLDVITERMNALSRRVSALEACIHEGATSLGSWNR